MITNREEAELLASFIHIVRLMDMSKDKINTIDYQKMIIERINENPIVLQLQSEQGNKNIGMIACEYDLFFVVNRCLKDRKCVLQQDDGNKTIGHILASKKTTPVYDRNLEREEDIVDVLVKKILKDNIASIIQDNDGNNIGMLMAKRKSKKAVKLARKNEYAMKQTNNNGETIDDIARANGLLPPKERTK